MSQKPNLLFDTHTHLYDDRFDEDRDSVIEACHQALKGWINVGSDLSSTRVSIGIAKAHPVSFASSGIHPHDAAAHSFDELEEVISLYTDPVVVAAGEMGLDYYYDNSPREIQKDIFRAQLKAAKSKDMPCIIHVRDAFDDFFQITDEVNYHHGVVHCFSGNPELAQKSLDRGFYLGFGGIITFKNAQEIRDSLGITPMSRILLETDCPYLAPVPRRGKRNEPAYVKYVAEKIAEIKEGASRSAFERIARLTTENSSRLFKISQDP